MSKQSLRIATAQLDMRVGDIAGNARRIIEAVDVARQRDQADVLVCPELSLLGQPAGDLVCRQETRAAVDVAMDRLATASAGITLVVGYPEYTDTGTFDAVAVLREGRRIAHYRRQCLTDEVLDMCQAYQPGHTPCIFDQGGHRIGILMGAELQQGSLVAQTVKAGAELIVCPDAAPFCVGSGANRETIIAQRAAENSVAIFCANWVGGQDVLVFDGQSCAVDSTGCLASRAPLFEAGVHVTQWTPTKLSGEVTVRPADEAQVYDALVRATRDYVERNGFPGALIGASGGIDSALTLAIAADALGGDRVWAVSMPSRYTADISNIDAAEQAERMGLRYNELAIEQGFAALLDTLSPLFADREPDTTEENLQPRLRGDLLMALSNKFGHVVLATGNKSEVAVGYATLYGDMCGGFAPLQDVYKTWVYRLARFRNERGAVIPERVITRPPSAELRDNQLDADSLPDYDLLDSIIQGYVEENASIADLCARGYSEADVRKVVTLIRRNEYKRAQAAPGPKVTARAFGWDWRHPITATYGAD